ncbi:MAG: hypothetical protein E6J90_21370 [Deltaproteobacteria bacterium]|nr:MAG: hypothetical protein E6J90_21370 [Deltaproteobacteria bacterium]TMQ19220.1 MAG: hypothetical protein E6J91_06730 [Deltaproteobacteria bacterium]
MSPALALLVLTQACFGPHYNQLKCGVGDSCPSGYTCRNGSCESGPADDAATGDASIDAAIDAPADQLCAGTFVRICVKPPTSPMTLMTQPLNTVTSNLCVPYVATPPVDACVIAAVSITIPAGNKVSVIGSKRLILLSASSLTISGTLDAASHRGGSAGPAGDSGPCSTSSTNPTAAGQGGGGWGGSFGSPGGNGGSTAGGGIGGIAPPALAITALGGGCSGGNGANVGGTTGGTGGRGGGAVALLANQQLLVDGAIDASGAGGNSGKLGSGGGGGGGAGGMIVIEAPVVRISGICFANGGGGGEGGDASRDGNSGGEPAAPGVAAPGGSGASAPAGDGGNGSFAAAGATTGQNGSGTGGGGGGGGGAGILKIISADLQNSGAVSPPPSQATSTRAETDRERMGSGQRP